MPKVKGVVRELEIEERRLGLLVLTRRGQHIVASRAVSVIATSMTTISSSDSKAARHAAESASEWAGLLLSTIIARKRSGWSVRISSGHRVARYQPAEDRRAGDRGAADIARVAEQRSERRMQVLPTTFGEVAGQDPQQLVQIGAQRAVRRLLDAEVLEHRDALGAGDAPRRGADQFLVDAASLRVVADGDVAQCVDAPARRR